MISSIGYQVLGPAAALVTAIDPGVTANSNAPFLAQLRSIAGIILVASIILVVIALIVGTVLLVFSKITHNSRGQEVGLPIVGWCLLGAAIIGSASGLVMWGSGFTLS